MKAAPNSHGLSQKRGCATSTKNARNGFCTGLATGDGDAVLQRKTNRWNQTDKWIAVHLFPLNLPVVTEYLFVLPFWFRVNRFLQRGLSPLLKFPPHLSIISKICDTHLTVSTDRLTIGQTSGHFVQKGHVVHDNAYDGGHLASAPRYRMFILF